MRARRVIDGKAVEIEQKATQQPSGLAGKIVRAIDRADAQGRGCSGCKAVRQVAKKMVTKLARPARS